MNILTYPDQLRMLANENNVEISDACKLAGIPSSTYHRSVRDETKHMSLTTAERIANAIVQLGSQETVSATHAAHRGRLAAANH